MRRWLVLFLLIAVIGGEARCGAESFDKLGFLTVENVIVRYNPSLTKIINRKTGDETSTYEVLETRIDEKSQDKYLILFDQGMSDDPTFYVVSSAARQEGRIGSICATELLIPGNGFIYAAGHKNTMFNQRRKFRIASSRIEEVAQPYYYVGLDTKTLTSVTLFRDITEKDVVAQLPKDESVTVLLNSGDFYLLRTSFGLLGWVKIEPFRQESTLLEGIFYNGD